MKNIVLIGGGGHCISCIDVIEESAEFEIHGILDANMKKGSKIGPYEILGSDDLLLELVQKKLCFHITIGMIKSNATRASIFNKIEKLGGELHTVISPLAFVSKNAQIGKACTIMHKALINAGASVGDNSIINTNSLIEHGAQIGAHTHISTAAVVNGDVEIGKRCMLGSNAIINHGLKICDDVTIGSGSTVVNDINVAGVYIGSPAVLKKTN